MNILSLLKPEYKAGKTDTKQDNKGASKGSVDRTLQDWLKGYMVYMSLVGTAYPGT